MSDATPRRRLLPLLTEKLPGNNGGRSAMTCQYRCGDACFHEAPNRSGNEYFGDVVETSMTRRGLLGASATAALVVGAGPIASSATANPLQTSPQPTTRGGVGRPPVGPPSDVPEPNRPLTFSPVQGNTVDTVVVPYGYDWSPLMAWGDPVEDGAPEFDFDNLTIEGQRKQFGYNCDFVAVLPMNRDRSRALLWTNHEYTNEDLMWRGWEGPENATEEQLMIAMAAHGGSVVEIERIGDTGEWRRVDRSSRYNRRLHTHSEFTLVGPAAGSPLLQTSADSSGTVVLGTLNNCAGGTTPWGTVLSGEENFHQYFAASSDVSDPEQAERNGRYGLPTTAGTARGWQRADDRFDVINEPNEPHRFGWIVEIDPYDPNSTPRKLTALGRFKHEGATVSLAEDGRAVAYMGDDERFDYVYKFVSANTYRPGDRPADRRHNMRLLEEGDLYVAKFTGNSPEFPGEEPADGLFDGTGEWLPLIENGESMVSGFSVEEVLIFTRLAADAVGATAMDRPEDVERNEVTGTVYIALTNNSAREPGNLDEANPRVGNKYGHVIGLDEDGNDAAATSFTWSIVLLAGDPEDPDTYYGGYDKSQVSTIACPDNVAFDPSGRLWISTDGMAGSIDMHDGLFAVPVEGEDAGHLRRFVSLPAGAECCGPVITDDGRSAFIAVQHPGEGDGASPDNPLSTFPHGDQPRPAVCSIWRKAPDGSTVIGD